jgi:hypothetical protein
VLFVDGSINGGIDFPQFDRVQRRFYRFGRGWKKSEKKAKGAARQCFIHITGHML